ncbi:NAD(P)/FAD-dependent oxidoreductase [Methylobacterium platani]|uniref:Pyridine nucleotide-disulfide oxidoreductase n=2 Tax=Methylobacterium platani TaxID=427683 RepID=A0A179S3T5_9HYPH|nr:FAD-dependent oxidoreductase [Methylobacterium platani]KMO13118.1 pyridine nucleotide-disulfide oxidoreductase [Methylobacterium platani JCM 14648]OAS18545.1 pyridine nucleotide-disulfide oxidoreductase [Methylobacterium platani]
MAGRIVVVGGGFAGLWAAAAAARARDLLGRDDAVTLVAPGRSHVVRVRCYETDLAPIRVPYDDVLGPIGVAQVDATVAAIDPVGRRVVLQPDPVGETPVSLGYDRLILAAGSALRRPDVPGADAAFDVDTLAGAQRLAAHLERLVRAAAGSRQAGRWDAVVIGGGLVGLEIACELPARLARARDQAGDAGPVGTTLVDPAAQAGAAMGAAGPAIREALAAAGVRYRGGAGVAAIDAAGVTLSDGARLPALTVVLATGLRASPLAGTLGVPLDPLGRLPVDAFLRVEGVPGLFAAGDIAVARADAAGHRTVMSCQHARPMGRIAGHNAVCDLAGHPQERLSFEAPDYVTILDLGPWGAAYTAGWAREHLVSVGAAAKAVKRTINGSRIYPPPGRDRAAILAAAAPVIQARPAPG